MRRTQIQDVWWKLGPGSRRRLHIRWMLFECQALFQMSSIVFTPPNSFMGGAVAISALPPRKPRQKEVK